MTDDLAYSGLSVDYYDALYADKDYEAECDLIESLFDEYADTPVESVLDLGCGSGGHLVSLAERGYDLTGVDVSPRMLEHVRAKCEPLDPAPALHRQSIDALDLDEDFDAAIGMFSVLNYLTTNDELERGFAAIADHLSPDGLLVADVWYGPAVLHLGPEPRLKSVSTDDGQLFRFAEPTHRPAEQIVEVDYEFVLAGETTEQFSESHELRYLHPKELEGYLADVGLELRTLFESFDRTVDPSLETWSVTFVAGHQ